MGRKSLLRYFSWCHPVCLLLLAGKTVCQLAETIDTTESAAEFYSALSHSLSWQSSQACLVPVLLGLNHQMLANGG